MASINAWLAVEDSSYSQISCGPSSIAAKLLVAIVAVANTGGCTTYTIHAQLAGTSFEWTVQRRFSEFRQLRDDLVAFFARRMVQQCFGCRWFGQSLDGFAFPRRRLLSSRGPDVVVHRKCALEQFARLLASHAFSSIPKCVSCSKLPFARVRDFFVKGAAFPPHIRHDALFYALRVEHFSAIADPKKSKIEFRRGHGILRMLQIEKTVHSKRAHHEQAFHDQVHRDQHHARMRHHHHHQCRQHATSGSESRQGDWANDFDAEATVAKSEHASSRSENESDDDSDDGAMTIIEIDMTRAASARRRAPLPQAWDAAQSLAATITSTA